jgi:hypothetical protein
VWQPLHLPAADGAGPRSLPPRRFKRELSEREAALRAALQAERGRELAVVVARLEQEALAALLAAEQASLPACCSGPGQRGCMHTGCGRAAGAGVAGSAAQCAPS